VRAGLVDVLADSFEKGGKTIRFKRVWLTRPGRLAGSNGVDGVLVVQEVAAPPKKRRARAKTASPAVAKEQTPLDEAEAALFEKLREWRLEEARRRRVPAFRILSDRTLAAICRARPVDEEELLDVAGIGPAKASSYGRKILAVVTSEPNNDNVTAS